MKTATNTIDVRIANAMAIYRLLRKEKSITKSQIAKSVELSFASSSNICSQLVEKNLINIEENVHSTGGRKAATLSFNPEYSNILVIDLNNTRICHLGLLDMSNTVKKVLSFRIKKEDNLETVLENIKLTYEILSNGSNVDLLGVCVGISAVFVESTGTTLSSSNPLFEGINLKREIEELFPSKIVTVENDANLAALSQIGESLDNSFLFIFLSQGIGMGIILGGELYKGCDGFAGELGHIKVRNIDKVCKCGHKGCLRMVGTLESIAVDLNELETLTTSDYSVSYTDSLKKRFDNNDPMVVERIELTGVKLGEVIAQLQDIFNPQKIILGGNMGRLFPIINKEVRKTCREFSKLSKTSDLQIDYIETYPHELILKGGCENLFTTWLESSFGNLLNQ